MFLSYYRAVCYDFRGSDKPHFPVTLLCHQYHSLGLYPPYGAGSKVCQYAYLLSNHVLGAVILGNPGYYGPLVYSRIYGEFQEFVRLGDTLGGEDGSCAYVHAAEIIERNLLFLGFHPPGSFFSLLGGGCGRVCSLYGLKLVRLDLDDIVLNLGKQQGRLSKDMALGQYVRAAEIVPPQDYFPGGDTSVGIGVKSGAFAWFIEVYGRFSFAAAMVPSGIQAHMEEPPKE